MWPDQSEAGEILHIYKWPSSSDIQPKIYYQASCLKAFCGSSKNYSWCYLDPSSPVHGTFMVSRKLIYCSLQNPKSVHTLWALCIVLLFIGGWSNNTERTNVDITYIYILLDWNLLSFFPNISYNTIRLLYHLFQYCFFFLTNHFSV